MKKLFWAIFGLVTLIFILAYLTRSTPTTYKATFHNALIIQVQDKFDTLDKSLIIIPKNIIENFIIKTKEPKIKIDNLEISKDDLSKLLQNQTDTIEFNDFKVYNNYKKQPQKKKDIKVNIKFKPDDGRDSSLVDIKIYCGNYSLEKNIQYNNGKKFVIETENYSKTNSNIDKVEIPIGLIKSFKNIFSLFANEISKKDMELLAQTFAKEKLLLYVNNYKDSTQVIMYIK